MSYQPVVGFPPGSTSSNQVKRACPSAKDETDVKRLQQSKYLFGNERKVEVELVLKSLADRTFTEENRETLGELAGKIYNSEAVRALFTLMRYPTICPPLATIYFMTESKWAPNVKTLSITLDPNSPLSSHTRFLLLCLNLESLHLALSGELSQIGVILEQLESIKSSLRSNKVALSIELTLSGVEEEDPTPISDMLKFCLNSNNVKTLKVILSDNNLDCLEQVFAISEFKFNKMPLLKSRQTRIHITIVNKLDNFVFKWASKAELLDAIALIKTIPKDQKNIQLSVLSKLFPEVNADLTSYDEAFNQVFFEVNAECFCMFEEIEEADYNALRDALVSAPIEHGWIVTNFRD